LNRFVHRVLRIGPFRLRSNRRPGVSLVLVALAACSSGVADSGADGDDLRCGPAVAVSSLPDELSEASGIARDPRRSDLFWLHNDSGHDPVLFAVDSAGDVVGRAAVVGATNRDVEDIALAGCPEGWCLYYADMGDNLAIHDQIYVYRLPLPELPAESLTELAPVSPLASYTMVYPGGPRDAETLFVDSDRGELGIVTKGRDGKVELYVADLQTLESVDGPVVLQRIGQLDVLISPDVTALWVTAGDLSPDGTRLAVRSYVTLYLFAWAGSAAFDTSVTPASANLTGADEPQGEGLTFDLSGERFYMASEGTAAGPPQISRIDCRP
jgi:hypothetical protein